MDAYEQMAYDLECAQEKRYRKSKKSDDFWDERETFIFERIKSYRQSSSTYHPENQR